MRGLGVVERLHRLYGSVHAGQAYWQPPCQGSKLLGSQGLWRMDFAEHVPGGELAAGALNEDSHRLIGLGHVPYLYGRTSQKHGWLKAAAPRGTAAIVLQTHCSTASLHRWTP